MTPPRKPDSQLRALVWCAVSTRDQAEPEHYSPQAQKDDGLAIAKQMGWTVVDVMSVDGHSRARRNLDALAIEAEEKGFDAFRRLLDHLTSCDFDVLICRDANRFARKSSMLHQIVEMVYEDCGAFIYSLTDGKITDENWSMWAAMKGYQTAQEWRWIRKAFQDGGDKLTERGLSPGPWTPITHRRLRDPKNGKQIGYELDARMTQVMQDAAIIVLEGLGWMKLGDELYARYGHTDDTGRPWLHATLYNLFYNPMTWGHKAFRHTKYGQYGHDRLYILDERFEKPEKVKLARNVVPPVFTGELADRLRDELIRRAQLRGSARPSDTYRYSGLIRCGHCGSSMNAYSGRGKRIGVRCMFRYVREARKWGRTEACVQPHVNNKYLDAIFRLIVAQIVAGVDLDKLQVEEKRIVRLDSLSELSAVDAQMRRLIDELSTAPVAARQLFREQIDKLAIKFEQLKITEKQANRAVTEAELSTRNRQAVIDKIKANPDAFWQQSDTNLNADIRILLNHRKVIVKDFEFEGFTKPER